MGLGQGKQQLLSPCMSGLAWSVPLRSNTLVESGAIWILLSCGIGSSESRASVVAGFDSCLMEASWFVSFSSHETGASGVVGFVLYSMGVSWFVSFGSGVIGTLGLYCLGSGVIGVFRVFVFQIWCKEFSFLDLILLIFLRFVPSSTTFGLYFFLSCVFSKLNCSIWILWEFYVANKNLMFCVGNLISYLYFN